MDITKTREDYLNERCAYTEYFKNKEFFPKLKEEDLDEVFINRPTTWDKPFKDESMCWNFLDLNRCADYLRRFLNTPMIITSGFRSKRKHLEIYAKKRRHVRSIPMSSRHLTLEAFDFVTKDLELAKNKLKMLYSGKKNTVNETYLRTVYSERSDEFIEEQVENLDQYYFEDFDHTPSWIHVQMVAPRSKSRFFIP